IRLFCSRCRRLRLLCRDTTNASRFLFVHEQQRRLNRVWIDPTTTERLQPLPLATAEYENRGQRPRLESYPRPQTMATEVVRLPPMSKVRNFFTFSFSGSLSVVCPKPCKWSVLFLSHPIFC